MEFGVETMFDEMGDSAWMNWRVTSNSQHIKGRVSKLRRHVVHDAGKDIIADKVSVPGSSKIFQASWVGGEEPRKCSHIR